MHRQDARTGIAAFAACAVLAVAGGVDASFDADTITSNGVKVADWMLAHPKRANHRDWSYGAFYAGLAEFALETDERRYIDAIRDEGRSYGWTFEKRDADVGNTHCIGQAWLDIARAERDDAVVASVRAELDAFMAAHVNAPLAHSEGERVVLNRRRWYWCDALFMSPPVWSKLAAITGERKYLDFMVGEYRATYDHLYDREDHLFWRDARYVGRTTSGGKKLFWGRGNGWVLAGLPLVIRELPADSAERRWFAALFKEMCAKVRTIQRADGAWSASLLDAQNPDAPEMSATAFFCYAFAWGVNNGVLDEATYLPCVERAWEAMCRCVEKDGKFGWVQPIGESPVKNFGPDSTETYGAGGYLLAATELRRYALAHGSRVEQIAARLPEKPCTPAPRPCDRAAWAPLANDPAAAAIVASAEKLVGAEIDKLTDDLYRDFSRTGNRTRYEQPYFRKAYRLNLFMVAEALEWKGRFVPEIRRYLESILDERVWTIPATDTKDIAFVKGQPVICLFSANRAWIVAYAANWFADVLPPELVARAKSECRKRVLDLYLAACRNPSLAKGGGGDPLWWFFARTNWSPVCHAGCVGAALAILDSRRERAECLEAVERAMPHYFRGFGKDGYCSEGMGYWNYGFGHYVALRAMAEQATDGMVTLDSPMAATVAAYAVNFQLENGLSPHFADGGGAPDLSLLDLCHRFWPKEVPDPCVGALALGSGSSASFSPCPPCAFIALRAFGAAARRDGSPHRMVALSGGRGTRPACPLPVRSVFPQSQVYLMRPGGGKSGLALAVKGGHNGELHNHNDVGSYAISLGGEVLCGDVGGELYSRRTFSSRRYESEVLNSFGHPVPRPGVLQRLGSRYAAKIIRTEFKPGRDTVVFDLTGAYSSKTLKRLHRKFIYDRTAQTVTIRDEVDFKEPTEFDDPLTTLVGVNDKFEFVGKKGRLAVDVETSGGEWEWDVRTLDNGRGGKPVANAASEEKWTIWVAGKTQNTPPDGRPRRIAVKFKKPVMSAMVEFHFKAVALDPVPENVPELMRTFSGEDVKTREVWENCGEVAEKFYRLAIRGIRGGDIVQLGEFSLYAVDGSRVNGGGMKLVEPCAANALAPGECFASRKNFARETADKLFDGDPKTKLCVGKLSLRESDPTNCLAVYFRLPDGAKPVVKYNFCSADDTDRYPERNPTSWAIWCSADGKTWRLLDERTNAFSPKSMLTWWNGSRPYSFGGERPCTDMADEVNPFIGAVTQHPRSALGGHGLGKTFPGAATPCGMIQLSPDTVTGGDNGCGYSYHHETIEGFSFMHLSGVGWYGDLGNFQVMPTTGARNLDRDKAKSAYSHEREVAEAGYYAVTLDRYGIRAEMAAAPRAGILRFTFPESKDARIQIDLGRRIGQLGRWLKRSRQHVRVVDDHTIEGRMECPWEDGGWGHGAGRVRYVVNFTCAFSKPFKRFGVWDKDKVFENCRDYTGTNTGFFAEFETSPGEQILMRAGLSYVDQEGARKNLASDIPDFDFDRARSAARALWSDAFAGVKVKGGSPDDRAVFATCLYHALIDPRMIGDVDGRYMGSDGKIYRNERFTARTVFSGWDVFRSEMPLLTLIRPDIVNDTINSMLRWNELGPRDTLPVWDLFGCTSGCMVGNPIIPCIADAYEKGIRNWDADTAWRLADNTSRRRGNADCGWTPNSISVTLEYAYDDWCMGKFAEMLGKKEDAKRYYERAGWYRNIWNKEVGWMRSRKADGTWAKWRGRHVHGQGAVESNPWQQGWFVPHDIYGLMELMGGEGKFAEELEAFFDKSPSNFLWGDCYNHPNEVTHLVPFMFPYCGKPWLTQKWTRRICEGAYGNEVYGYVGNEDEGQMSAWYILAASGLHPACPGSGVWILTSPMFPEVSFRISPEGRASPRAAAFTIRANGVPKENIYIRSAKLNGKPLDRAWVTTKEVSDGGLLELEMGAEPAKGAFPVRPPSGDRPPFP